jgi:hypothetical protein
MVKSGKKWQKMAIYQPLRSLNPLLAGDSDSLVEILDFPRIPRIS